VALLMHGLRPDLQYYGLAMTLADIHRSVFLQRKMDVVT
jgi:hypothetical protein